MRWWVFVGLGLLFVLRIDIWWWRDASMIGGLPIGLAYQIAFCFLVAAFFALVVKKAWPRHLEVEGGLADTSPTSTSEGPNP